MNKDISLFFDSDITSILALACTQAGLFIYQHENRLRISTEKVATLAAGIDIIVAMDICEVTEHRDELKQPALIIYNENTIRNPPLATAIETSTQPTQIAIAMDSFAKTIGHDSSFRDYIALGALSALLGLQPEQFSPYLQGQQTKADCLIAGFGHVKGLELTSPLEFHTEISDTTRLYINGSDGLCLALRKAGVHQISDDQNTQLIDTSLTQYQISRAANADVIFTDTNFTTTSPSKLIICHYSDFGQIVLTSKLGNHFIASDISSLYSSVYWALLQMQVDQQHLSIIYVADEILASSQTLTELPLPNEQAIAPYSTHGSERGRINMIGIGTNKNIAIEAIHLLKQQQISAKYTHLSHWQEYEPEIKADIEKAAITFFLSPLRQPSSSFPNATSIDIGNQAQTSATKLSSLMIKKLKESGLA